MKLSLPLIAITTTLLASIARAETAKVSWTLDSKTNSYVNEQTRLAFRPSVAGFRSTRATPANDDGSASFGYEGRAGVITLYLRHRGISDCPREGDCVPRFLASYREDMKKRYGKSDLERSFSIVGRCAGRSVRGGGTTYHFLRFPDRGGISAYSEVGAVQIGDFLYYYRGTFPSKEGLKDLADFLRALGLRKV